MTRAEMIQAEDFAKRQRESVAQAGTPCLKLPNDRTPDQARGAIDLSRPSYRGAYHLAREAAYASMRAAKRDKIIAADKEAGDKVIIPLLWLVEAADGGFIGLDDDALEKRCARYRLSLADVNAAMWAPGEWPKPATVIDFPCVDERVGAGGL